MHSFMLYGNLTTSRDPFPFAPSSTCIRPTNRPTLYEVTVHQLEYHWAVDSAESLTVGSRVNRVGQSGDSDGEPLLDLL